MNLPKAISHSAVFCLLLLLKVGVAKAESFPLKASQISLTVPKEWQKSINFLQNPLTLFGPISEANNKGNTVKRAAWIFSDAVAGNESLNKKKLEEKQNEYFQGRLKWMAKRGATFVDKVPYKVYRTRRNIEIHQIGVTYRLADLTYTEESLFFLCGKALVNISRLTPENDKDKLEDDYQVIMNSLTCSEL